jgi:hypothetical protein
MIEREAEHMRDREQVRRWWRGSPRALRENPGRHRRLEAARPLLLGARQRFPSRPTPTRARDQGAARRRSSRLISPTRSAMARGQSLQGEPEKLVLRALEIDPKKPEGAGARRHRAFERKDFQKAADYLEAACSTSCPPARGRAARSRRTSTKALALKGSRVLRGEVRLSEKLRDKASPDDLVFIFARAVEGPPMPLAVVRKRVRDLPLSFALDDSMAMAPGLKLSGHPRVVISARVSKTASPIRSPATCRARASRWPTTQAAYAS